ncbi:MAG TPA: RNA polymerase sigma factor [Acidobacteriaceae bacterium]|jgi:RNA polymerase sigma-70 factor (ECF subfamily)
MPGNAERPSDVEGANRSQPPGCEQELSSDEQLMESFAKGSQDAFTELFARYKQPLYGFFRRRLLDTGFAEELTQETFLALLRAPGEYEPRATFRTYLYAIGLNLLRSHRRKAAFRATFLGSTDREPAARSVLDTELMMREAVRKLDGQDREVLMLREFEQLTYAEIAGLLHMPLNTVRSRLFRARTALRTMLSTPVRETMTTGFPNYEEGI